MKHLFVINPQSFKDKAAIEAVVRYISGCFDDAESFEIHISRYPRDAVGVVSKFAQKNGGRVRVYAVGGDGILFDCAGGIINWPESELATVPYGMTNDFARSAGDSSHGFRNLPRLIKSPSALTDVISCGSNYSLNFCSVGVESEAIIKWYRWKSALKVKSRRTASAMLTVAGVCALLNKGLVNQHYELTIDGRDYSGCYGAVSIVNGPHYGGDKTLIYDAKLNDGLADVLLVKSVNRPLLMKMCLDYIKGKYKKYPKQIVRLEAREIQIRSKKPLRINLDGEIFHDSALSLQILPSAVRIIGAGGVTYGEGGRL